MVGNNPVNMIDPWGLKAGDWWDYPANIKAVGYAAKDKALRKARASGLPDANRGKQDAYRHATWNKIMTDEMGAFNALVASTAHEIYDNGYKDGTQTWDDFRMDMHNNIKGALSGDDPMDLLNNGELRVNDGITQDGYDNYNNDKCKE
jgi:hypothetical protein